MPFLRPGHLLLLLVAAALLLAPATAAGAGAGGYASHAWPGCGGGTNSGSFDDAGRTYVPCGSLIGVYDPAGQLIQSIDAGRHVTDVAATRDAAYLYLAGPGAPSRLARSADGSYHADASWVAARYPIWGTTYPAGGNWIDVDAAGNVYLADGMWHSNLVHTVVKYDSAGRFITRFGEYRKTWDEGDFYHALAGLAVSSDGQYIYTAEVGNNRVQRFRRAGTQYVPDGSFGGTAQNNPDREGYCDYGGWRGAFAASYDVALDRNGRLYVMNTTCKQVLVFASWGGALVANLDLRAGGVRPHGFAVGPTGVIYVGESGMVLRPAGGEQPAAGAPPQPGAAPPPAPAPAPPTDDSADIVVTPRPSRPPGAAPQRTADRRAPRISLPARSVRSTRTRAGLRRVRVAPRCNERCRVEVRVLVRGRTITRRVRWLGRGVRGRMAARIPHRIRRNQRSVVQLRISDRAGNARTIRRALRLR